MLIFKKCGIGFGVILSLALVLSGCGGGGGGDTSPQPTTYIISGTVNVGAGGVALAGATITLTGGAATTTDTNGNYSFAGLANGNYTVTPTRSNFTFSPSSSAVTIADANSTANNFVATETPGTYSQADLTGTWNIQVLTTGSNNGWRRGTATVDPSGSITSFSGGLDSAGKTLSPPAGSIQWTIDASGVISGSGVNEAEKVHMTMTSNKNFIAGTAEDTDGDQLRIIQKVVPGTVYSNADVQNKSFVIHGLTVSTGYNDWTYEHGTTNASGMISFSDDWSPDNSGAPVDRGPQSNIGTFSVDSSGTVTIDTLTGFQGFLSADKKTIVGVWTEIKSSSTYYTLMVIQITGQTYTAGPLPAGISAAHMLAIGNTAPAPFWLHFTSTVASGGLITLSDWVSSNAGITNPGTTNQGSISASGTVTITEKPTYHGQVSDDGKFIVATQTNASGVYSLQVNTK